MAAPLIELYGYNTPKIIKVIGVGGGGGNAVGQMYRDNIAEVRCVVVNTDKKALATSIVPEHVQIGPGLGAGGNPTKGRELAEADIDKIRNLFDEQTRMVFITAGMGGGTGTGASPIIAHEARKRGILTVGIVTIPFLFEREASINKALDGLDRLAEEVDALLVINNQRLFDVYPDCSVIDAFKRADETLSIAVRSITEIITMHGRIILDFEDVCSVLKNGGVAVISTGYGEGDNRITKAIESALNSPLLNNKDVYRSNRIILCVTMNDDEAHTLRTSELSEITEFMQHFPADIYSKWGLKCDSTLGAKVKVTLLASGFGLYNKKTTQHQALTEADIKRQQQNALRREMYYIERQKQLRCPNHIYLFSDDDLRNEQLLEQVESTPTYRRTSEQYNQIKKQSKTH